MQSSRIWLSVLVNTIVLLLWIRAQIQSCVIINGAQVDCLADVQAYDMSHDMDFSNIVAFLEV